MIADAGKKGVITLIREELCLLIYDKWLLFSVTLLPAGICLFFFLLFRQGIVHELPVAVVDMDNSQLSRSLIRSYDASSNLEMRIYPSMKEATAAIRRTEVYGIIAIPPQMERNLNNGISPEISAFYNFQYILIGNVLKSAFANAHATFNAKISTLKGMSRGNVQLVQAQAMAVPTRKQLTPLYNINVSYAQYLVTGLIPTVWQILMVAVTILIWAAEQRRSGITNWLRQQAITKIVIRLGWYQLLFLTQGFLFLAAFLWQGWIVHGDLAALVLSQWLMILASQAVASLYALCLPDAPRALSAATAYVAPSFAFLGLTFPASDMNLFAQCWRAMLPVSHYMEIQIGVMNYGVSFEALFPSFRALFCFLPLFVVIAGVILLRKRFSQTQQPVQGKNFLMRAGR